jgi:hypothetical protein
VNFLSAFSMEPSPASAFGHHGRLVSLAYDVLVPGILHASTEAGDILVFDTRDRMLEDRGRYPLLRKITGKAGEPRDRANTRDRDDCSEASCCWQASL